MREGDQRFAACLVTNRLLRCTNKTSSLAKDAGPLVEPPSGRQTDRFFTTLASLHSFLAQVAWSLFSKCSPQAGVLCCSSCLLWYRLCLSISQLTHQRNDEVLGCQFSDGERREMICIGGTTGWLGLWALEILEICKSLNCRAIRVTVEMITGSIPFPFVWVTRQLP